MKSKLIIGSVVNRPCVGFIVQYRDIIADKIHCEDGPFQTNGDAIRHMTLWLMMHDLSLDNSLDHSAKRLLNQSNR